MIRDILVECKDAFVGGFKGAIELYFLPVRVLVSFFRNKK